MYINQFDHIVHNFEAYAEKFKEITNSTLTHEEWVQISEYLAQRQKIKPPIVGWDTFKKISDLYSNIFTQHNVEHAHIPMILRILWANHVGIITDAQFDVMNRMWRKAC